LAYSCWPPFRTPMPDATFFDQLKSRLLNHKWIAYGLVALAVISGAIKLYKDVRDVVPRPPTPNTAPADSSSAKSDRLLLEKMLTPVYFPNRNAEVSPEDRSRIIEAAAKLKLLKFRSVLLTSHTEAQDPASNVELSKSRAFAVREVLEAAGLAPEQVSFSVPAGLQAKEAPAPGYANRTEFRILWQ
jgi:outer membrane protein OmpA-like peptidoglycan-associated protein